MKVDNNLNEEEYVFDGAKLKSNRYVAYQMRHGAKKRLNLGRINMSPIIEAFRKTK